MDSKLILSGIKAGVNNNNKLQLSGFRTDITYINYGLLYNWYAATDVKNIANTGWHVSTRAEWQTVFAYYGALNECAYALIDPLKWSDYDDIENITNESRLGCANGGERDNITGVFARTKWEQNYLTSVSVNSDQFSGFYFYGGYGEVDLINSWKKSGLPLRLVKDETELIHGESGTYTGNDGKVYKTISIDGVEWLADNLTETKYRNGTLIPEVTIDASWAALTTGALCAYNNDWSNALANQIINSNKLILGYFIYETPVEAFVTTSPVTSIEGWSAKSGGNCTAGGNSTYKGICWSTSLNPTITDSSALYGSRGEGSYTNYLTGLTSDTSYYVRAFAYNALGVVYGSNQQFSTPIVYTPCATYGLDFNPPPSSTGFLDCGVVVADTGDVSNYTIEWKYESSIGEVVFISGSLFEYDASIQAQHPLTDEIVISGTLYPVVKSIIINGIKYSAYNIPDASYSPDLRNCLPKAVISPIDCCTKLGNDVLYPYVITYNNTTDYALNKSRTIKYDICQDAEHPIKYLAWDFNAYDVPEQLKIYYCTSTNTTGTILDNFIHGYYDASGNYLVTNLYPNDYPNNPRIHAKEYSPSGYNIRYITRFDNITYSLGDYLKIQIIGSVYDAAESNTNWDLKLKSISNSDISCGWLYDTNYSKMAGDPSLRFDDVNCRYWISYNTSTAGAIPSKFSSSSPFIWTYLNMNTISAGTSFMSTNPIDMPLIWSTFSQPVAVYIGDHGYLSCHDCNPGQSITYSLQTADVSAIIITCTDASDYDAFVSNINYVKASSRYTNWLSTPDTSVEYYSYYDVWIKNASSCGDTTTYDYFEIHLSSDVSWNSTTKTITMPIVVPTNNIPLPDVSCDTRYSQINSLISQFNIKTTRLPYGNYLPIISKTRIITPIAGYFLSTYNATTNSMTIGGGYYIYDAMLNGICDLSTYGFVYDLSLGYGYSYINKWTQLRYFDIATLTNTTNASTRLQNWKLERKKFLRTDVSTDIQFETVYEVSLGVKL